MYNYTKENLKESLLSLLESSNIRPFLFRTRFERCMIRLSAYAKETQQLELYDLAANSLRKIKEIVDKSNTTVDGELRSYTILAGDINRMLEYF